MLFSHRNALAKVLLASLCISTSAEPTPSHLPVVDLGYQLHQAISYDEHVGAYNFSNIRFAAPPLGDLRFAAPVPPQVNRDTIQTGVEARICPQAVPSWMEGSMSSAASYTTNGSVTSLGGVLNDPRASEDCLFLDVVVPRKVFDGTTTHNAAKSKGVPVLVWIYGGGYASGSKSGQSSGSPIGLLRRGGGNNFLYVAINYRVGAFGWLGGREIQQNGVANAGLLDQRLALEWVQDNIHLFGGDPDRVTVMGESAGGGSILHQITAYGGALGPAPFQQAILQSPAFTPGSLDLDEQDRAYQELLYFANVSTIEELRQLPSEVLMRANAQQISQSPLGSFTYRPVVDGVMVPEAPVDLIAQGRFDTNVQAMLGYNGNDGIVFADFDAENETDYRNYIGDLLNLQSNETDLVATQFYPPVFDGSYGYVDEITRAGLTFQETVIQCNDIALATALGNTTYNYIYDVFPALHAQDVSATFNPDLDPEPSVFDPLVALQQLITSFTITGKPQADGAGEIAQYGAENTLLVLNATGFSTRSEEQRVIERCQQWHDLFRFTSL